MKALSYFLRSLFFVAIISSVFISFPSKDLVVFAAVSPSTRQEVLNEFQDQLKIRTPKYSSKQISEYKSQYNALLAISSDILKESGQVLDDSSYITRVMDRFETLLEGRKSVLSDNSEEKKVILDILELASALKSKATADSLGQGVLAGLGGGLGSTQNEQSIKDTANAEAKSAKVNGADPKKETCSVNVLSGEKFSVGACISDAFNWFIKSILLNIAGVFLWLSANMFNKAVIFGVLEFSKWAPDSLYPIWIVVRQIVSLVLVFVGLYLGFLYILGREDKFENYIPWVVIFGLFVNFSYPLARTAIDVSNIVTLKVYTSAFGSEVLKNENTSSFDSPGGRIMSSLGLSNLVQASVNNQSTQTSGLPKDLDIPGSILTVAYVFYASYVLFRFALLVIVRTVVSVFMIIASPLLLVDSVLPVLGDKAKEMRKVFLEQLAVGPVFMILFVITLQFLKAIPPPGVPTTNDQFVGISLTILLMIMMLHITLKVTTKIAGEAGAWGTEKLGKIGGFGLGVATGGTGLLARNTIGRAAAKFRDSDSKWVSEDNFVGRRLYNMSNSIAKSSFDLRNSNVVARGAGIAGLDKGLFGTGMGSGSKSNFDLQAENVKKSREAQRARIKTKLEREGVSRKADGAIERDENGVPILKKAGELDEYGKSRMQSFTDDRLKGSIFMTKEQKQAYDDEEVKAGEQALLDEYKKLKTTEDKKKFIEERKEELAKIAKTDKKLESVQARTLARVTQDLEKGRKEEADSLNEKVEEEYARYKGMTEDEQRKLMNRLTKEVRAGLQEKLDAEKKAGEATVAEVSQSTTNKPPVENSTNKASVEETNWEALKAPAVQRQAVPSTHTPSSAEMLAKRREEKLKNNTELARASMGEKIERKADEGNNSSEPEKPGFLKTPEERIRERGERIEAESSS